MERTKLAKQSCHAEDEHSLLGVRLSGGYSVCFYACAYSISSRRVPTNATRVCLCPSTCPSKLYTPGRVLGKHYQQYDDEENYKRDKRDSGRLRVMCRK